MHVTETLEAIQKLSIAQKRENFHQINSHHISIIKTLWPRLYETVLFTLSSPLWLRARWSLAEMVGLPSGRSWTSSSPWYKRVPIIFDDDHDDAFDDDDSFDNDDGDAFDDDDGWSPAENIACPLQGGSRGRICVGWTWQYFLDNIQIFKPDTLVNICFGMANICVAN